MNEQDLKQLGFIKDFNTGMWVNNKTGEKIDPSQVQEAGSQPWSSGVTALPQTQPDIAPSVSTPQSPDPAAVAPPSNNQVTSTDIANKPAQIAPDITTQSDSMDSKNIATTVGSTAGDMISPGMGTVVGAGIGAIGSAMEGDEETGLQKQQEEKLRQENYQGNMRFAQGETEALPVRTKYPGLSSMPSGPLRLPQRAAWAMYYGLGPDAPKPENKNLDYLRSSPSTPQSVAAAQYQRMQAAENRLRIAKLILYPLALAALLA